MRSVFVQPTDTVATADLSEALRGDAYRFLQLQVTMRDSAGTVLQFPGSGDLEVKGRSLHASTFVALLAAPLWLPEGLERLVVIDRVLAAIQFTPTSFGAGDTYEVTISFGR